MNHISRTNILVSFVNIITTVVIGFLGFRFLLRFFGANPQATFVEWVYGTSEPLLAPFIGVFPEADLQGPFVIEFSTLFAMIVYGVVAYLLVELIGFIQSAMGAHRDSTEKRADREADRDIR